MFHFEHLPSKLDYKFFGSQALSEEDVMALLKKAEGQSLGALLPSQFLPDAAHSQPLPSASPSKHTIAASPSDDSSDKEPSDEVWAKT